MWIPDTGSAVAGFLLYSNHRSAGEGYTSGIVPDHRMRLLAAWVALLLPRPAFKVFS